MAPSLKYLIHNYQPICGLILGIIMLVFTFLINYSRTKINTIEWLKQKLYKDNERSDYLTAKFIDGVSKYVLLVGLSLILLAIYFLQNIT
jgi:uncharacterized integral membrane protein